MYRDNLPFGRRLAVRLQPPTLSFLGEMRAAMFGVFVSTTDQFCDCSSLVKYACVWPIFSIYKLRVVNMALVSTGVLQGPLRAL